MKPPSRVQKVVKFFADLIPVRIVTRFDQRYTPAAIAHAVSVDEIHNIFRAAENGDPERLFALYRDIILAHAHLQGRFADRKRAVLGDTLNLNPFDKKKAEDTAAVDLLWPVTQHPDWLAACNHLLDAGLYPVAVVEKVFRPSAVAGQAYELARLIPVPHELLDFTTGRLRIKDTDERGRPLSTCHDADPFRYIVHRGHLLTTPDSWGGPLRSLVFWWLLSTQDREWWGRFLDRYGSPFVIGKYDTSDDGSRLTLMNAFAYATKVGGLVVSRDTEVEIKQAASADAGMAFEKFHTICNEEMSKLILGQTLSSDAKSTGMGSGVANAQGDVRQDIRQFDAKLLGATFTTQLATQFLQINGKKGRAPIFAWGAVSAAELQSIAGFLTSLPGAGLEVADAGIEILTERGGIPLQRAASSAGGGSFGAFRAFSASGLRLVDRANDSVARETAATLARNLGRHYAPVRQIILDSKSPQDALAKVEAYAADLRPGEAARVIEEALLAYAANGSVAQVG